MMMKNFKTGVWCWTLRTGTRTTLRNWAVYDDEEFQDRSVVLDFKDQDKDNFEKLGSLDDFNDKTSSMLWCLREGCTGTIYEHSNFGGSSITLPRGNGGNGEGGQRHDMATVKWNGKDWNDGISSVKLE